MIDKGNIIKNALLKLGDITNYNDDRSRIYQACETLIEDVVKSVCSDTSLNFNNTIVRLTTNDIEDGEYKFNLPIDFLGIAKMPKIRRTVSSYATPPSVEFAYYNKDYTRVQGEFLYSNKSDIKLCYSRNIPLNEFPDYTFDLLVWKLARDISLINPAFIERLSYCESKIKEELYKVQKSEGVGVFYE